MYLSIQPQSTNLTDEQARILDDEFFLSDPLGHFTSRITMLLATSRTEYEATPESEPEFFKILGPSNGECQNFHPGGPRPLPGTTHPNYRPTASSAKSQFSRWA